MPVIFLMIFFFFSSFAFGCTENWSIATCEFLLFFGAGISSYFNKDFFKWPQRLAPFAIITAILIAICLIQLIPFPISFWKTVDPGRIQMFEDGCKSEELLQSEQYRKDPFEKTEIPVEVSRYTPPLPSFLTISRAPILTSRGLIALLSFFCFILLLEAVVKEGSGRLRNLGLFVGLIGVAIGLIALVEKGIENRTHVLWLRESSRAPFAFGPFVNGNHGEAFINLAFPIIYYLLWRKSNDTGKMSDKIGMRFIIVALLILQFALVVSGSSKGNFLSLCVMPVVILLHYGSSRRNIYLSAGALIILAMLVGMVVFLFQTGLLTDEVRVSMNANILSRFILSGYGVGCFGEVFPAMVVDWPIYKPMRNVFLENEYLQLYIEVGILSILPIMMFISAILHASYRATSRRGSTYWLVPPLVSEVIRAWVDMSFHIFPLAAAYLLLFSLAAYRRD